MRAPRSSVCRRGAAAVLAIAIGWLFPTPAFALRTTQEGAGLEELAGTLRPAPAGELPGETRDRVAESWAQIRQTFHEDQERRIAERLNDLYELVRLRVQNGRLDREAWERRMAIAEVVAVAGRGAGLPANLRGLVVAAVLLHGTPANQRWGRRRDGGFGELLRGIARRGRVHPRVAEDMIGRWVALQDPQQSRREELSEPTQVQGARQQWLRQWEPRDVTTADQLLLYGQQVAAYLVPGEETGAGPQGSSLVPEEVFQQVRPSVEFLLRYLDPVDPSYRITWRLHLRPLLADFLDALSVFAEQIGDRPTNDTRWRDAFVARWDLLRGALQEFLEDARTEQPRRSNPFQRIDASTARQLVSQLQHAKKGFTLRKPPHPIVMDPAGEVYRIVGVAPADGRLQLLPLADPREVIVQAVPELVTNHDQGYVALKRSLSLRSGLEEDAAWLEPLRQAVAVWQAPGAEGDAQAKVLLEIFSRAMADRAQFPGHSTPAPPALQARRQQFLTVFSILMDRWAHNDLATPSVVQEERERWSATVGMTVDGFSYTVSIRERLSSGSPLLKVAIYREGSQSPLGVVRLGGDRGINGGGLRELHLDIADASSARAWFPHERLGSAWTTLAMQQFLGRMFAQILPLPLAGASRAGVEEPRPLTAGEAAVVRTIRDSAIALMYAPGPMGNYVILGPSARSVGGVAEIVTVLQQTKADRALHFFLLPDDAADEYLNILAGETLVAGTVAVYAAPDDRVAGRFVEFLEGYGRPPEQHVLDALSALVAGVLADLGVGQAKIEEVLERARPAVGLEEAA